MCAAFGGSHLQCTHDRGLAAAVRAADERDVGPAFSRHDFILLKALSVGPSPQIRKSRLQALWSLKLSVHPCAQEYAGAGCYAPELHLKVVMALEGLHAHFLHMARQRAFRHRLILYTPQQRSSLGSAI